MTDEDREYMLSKIKEEGFDYTFMCYSEFKEIDDKYFHILREQYQEAHKKLKLYLETGINFDELK